MDSPEELERPPIATRMLGRILDHRKHLDYVWITLFAALPLAVSWLIGAHETVDGFKGYWERPNWVALVVLLPVAVLAVRWVMDRVAPVSQAWPLKSLPPIVDLIGTDAGKKQAYGALRRSLLSPWNLIAVLAINTAVHAVDMASLAGFYLADPDAVQISPRDSGPSYLTTRFLGMDIQVAADWSSMFVGETGVGRWESLGLSACAYAVQ